MNDKRTEKTFKSYINVSPKNNGERNGSIQEVKPKLLNGEQIVGAAHGVVLLAPLSDRDHGRLGSLYVTNYKFSFVPLEDSIDDECSQRNLVLGPHDGALTCVGSVWATDGGPARRRRLLPHGDVPAKLKGLQVVCKNMKVLTFRFSHGGAGQAGRAGQARRLALALLHHAAPQRHDLLFAFECREPYHPALPPALNMFARPADWRRELERCACPHWRLSAVNGGCDAFMLSAGATLVVPAGALDCRLAEGARHFRGGRLPVWVWGRAAGAALLRAGDLLATERAAAAESVLLEQIRRSHPKLTPPHVLQLAGPLPPLPALQASHRRLAELCTPATLREFWVQDAQYCSLLDASRWLRHVAGCLALADRAARLLADNVSVVLQEGDGVDYCAVVSSLTQLLLDPHCRTLAGFQSLVQKEWLALGHPFCDRFGLPRAGGASPSPGAGPPGGGGGGAGAGPGLEAPVFLLFLDGAWQLQRQFPASFQFSETYLTTLWDAAHNHLFDTFLFDCPRDRELARAKNFVERPVWDWGEQFSERDIALFYNPLYMADKLVATPKQRISSTSVSDEGPALGRLEPCTSLAGAELWAQCYERWLPPLDTCAAGHVQYHVFNCAVLAEIQRLNEKLSSLSILSGRRGSERAGEGEEGRSARAGEVSRFFPFSSARGRGAAPDCAQMSLIDASQLLDAQSLLNASD